MADAISWLQTALRAMSGGGDSDGGSGKAITPQDAMQVARGVAVAVMVCTAVFAAMSVTKAAAKKALEWTAQFICAAAVITFCLWYLETNPAHKALAFGVLNWLHRALPL